MSEAKHRSNPDLGVRAAVIKGGDCWRSYLSQRIPALKGVSPMMAYFEARREYEK